MSHQGFTCSNENKQRKEKGRERRGGYSGVRKNQERTLDNNATKAHSHIF